MLISEIQESYGWVSFQINPEKNQFPKSLSLDWTYFRGEERGSLRNCPPPAWVGPLLPFGLLFFTASPLSLDLPWRPQFLPNQCILPVWSASHLGKSLLIKRRATNYSIRVIWFNTLPSGQDSSCPLLLPAFTSVERDKGHGRWEGPSKPFWKQGDGFRRISILCCRNSPSVFLSVK